MTSMAFDFIVDNFDHGPPDGRYCVHWTLATGV